MAGPVYLAGALILGAGFLWCAIQFSRQLTLARARQLVSGLDPLSAAAAGGDGVGQSEITMETIVHEFPPYREHEAASRATRRTAHHEDIGFLAQIHFFHRPQDHRHPIRLHRAVLHVVRIFPDAADALADCASGHAGAGDRAAAGKNPRPAGGRRRRFRRNFTIPSARCTARSWCFSASCRWRSRRSAITSCR